MAIKSARQGDVYLRLVSEGEKATEIKETENRVVLAHGEVTGHAHAIYEKSKVKKLKSDVSDRVYIEVYEETSLLHEEHSKIPLKPGKYEVVLQREFYDGEIHRVAD